MSYEYLTPPEYGASAGNEFRDEYIILYKDIFKIPFVKISQRDAFGTHHARSIKKSMTS